MATDLTVEQIHSILEACAKTGVTELKFGALHAKFGQSERGPTHVGVNLPTQPPAIEIADAPNHEVMNRKALEAAEIATKEDQLEQLLIEDPLEYERQLLAGELELDEHTSGPESEEAQRE